MMELEWPGQTAVMVPFRLLRERCPCASCIDEITGRRILDPSTVPADIVPLNMNFIGNYALKIKWSDGHETGLYTWDHLHELAQQVRSAE